MRYFQDPKGETYGYDESDSTQQPYIKAALAAAWGEVTGNWPPAPTLFEAQVSQSSALSDACSAAVVAGFTSSALGSTNTYPSDVATQGNIDRAAVHGGTIWCESSAGAWSLTQHTAAQALQVQADLWTHIQICQSKLATLKAQVAAATTVSAVEAVIWS